MHKYIPTIGLEIHAELKTKSKMFCSCRNIAISDKPLAISQKQKANSQQPNTNVCPVCLGMPGTLPVINKEALNYTIDTGLYLNGTISKFTKWDRKNYFYPDLPKGYQISQYDLPVVTGGYIEITQNSNLKTQNHSLKLKTKKIRITRIHLEEDTGTSKHPEGREGINYSLLDYNRAGVPLMELVTEPDITSAHEAKEFCQKYQLALRHLKIADADMEKGQLRCEVNISLAKTQNLELKTKNHNLKLKTEIPNYKLGTKVEIKNLNSFRAVEKSIEYEIKRQTEILEEGKKVVQETRGWDDAKGKTYTMRIKETSADYRYFPEPDLPPVEIYQSIINTRKKLLPKSLEEIEKEYIEKFQISPQDAEILIFDIEKYNKFDEIQKNKMFEIKNAKKLANILINEPLAIKIKNEFLLELANLLDKNIISSKIFKEIMPEVEKGKSPAKIIEEEGLKQISDSGKLESIIEKVVKENPEVTAKIKAGKSQVIGFLVGQVMKETKGKANPKIVNEILRNKIK